MNRRSGTPSARKGVLVGATAAAFLMMAAPALAETCTGTAFAVTNGLQIAGANSSTAANIASAITTAQSAFLLQSTAFVSAPGNAQPDQQGSGVWTRAVGGEINLKSGSTNVVNQVTTGSAAFTGTQTVTCDTQVHTTFAGVQFGHDIAKLNYNGWNIHFGTTAGYLETRGNTKGNNFLGEAFTSNVQSPFAGTYLVASKGGFFADALLRGEYYEASFNSPATLGIANQSINARGVTLAASAGYNHAIPNTKWFVEPSAGVIHSRTKIDAFELGGIPAGGNGVPGTIQLNNINSTIGRAGVRVGTTFAQGSWVWQPFAAASVWHEFGDAPTGTYTGCCTTVGGLATQITSAYTGTSVGTYGQYSLGIAGQVVNTGWVAFARVDYRKGSEIDSWDGTGGVRYHFTPDAPVPVIGKAPVLKAPPLPVAFSWTGFYVGASAGADFGKDKMRIVTTRVDPKGSGFIGGVQAGYNYQFAPQWVAGIEGTWDWTNLTGSKACAPLSNNFTTQPLWNTTCKFDSDWLATLTGRLGYVWGRALWYVKAGGAYTRETITIRCNMIPAVFLGNDCPNAIGVTDLTGTGGVITTNRGGIANSIAGSDGRFGWTAGYGVEFAMTSKWTARAETSYYGFGRRNITLSDGTAVNSDYGILSTKIGVNYKLN